MRITWTYGTAAVGEDNWRFLARDLLALNRYALDARILWGGGTVISARGHYMGSRNLRQVQQKT